MISKKKYPNHTAETEMELDEHYQKVTLLCVDFPFEYHKEVFFFANAAQGFLFYKHYRK